MPITNGTYVSPTWNNNAPPAIDATELQAITDTTAEVPTLVRPNLLVNWCFNGLGSTQELRRFPINQRGKRLYTSSGYCIDRWNMSGGTVNLSNGGMSISSPSSGAIVLRQVIDAGDQFSEVFGGTVCTLSILMGDGSLHSTTGAVDVDSENSLRVNFTDGYCAFPYGLSVVISPNASKTISVVAIKLEAGPSQTLAHWDPTSSTWVLNEIPDFFEELSKCQRYFVKISNNGTQYENYSMAIATSTTLALSVLTLPCYMDTTVAPTLSIAGGFRLVTSGSQISVTNLTLTNGSQPYGNRVVVSASATGLTAGAAYFLGGDSSGTSNIFISTEP